MRSQSPEPRKNVVGPSVRPEPGSAATAIATEPQPNAMRTKVPRSSATHSPQSPPLLLSPLPFRTASGEMSSDIRTSLDMPEQYTRRSAQHPARSTPCENNHHSRAAIL